MEEFVKYKFRIHNTNPSTMPMARVAQYIAELARLMGCQETTHLVAIESASLGIVSSVRNEDVPLISPRIRQATFDDEKNEASSAWNKLNILLGEDNCTADLPLPNSAEIIRFPGTKPLNKSLRVVNQPTTIQGKLIRIQGAGEKVRIGLDIDGGLTAGISVHSSQAHELAQYFQKVVRLNGEGKWKRDENGAWSLDSLDVTSFEVPEDITLREALGRLQNLFPRGKGKEVSESIEELRKQ